MTKDTGSSRWDGPTERPDDGTNDQTVESYRTDGGVVFYDAYNPLAWVEASSTVRLDKVT